MVSGRHTRYVVLVSGSVWDRVRWSGVEVGWRWGGCGVGRGGAGLSLVVRIGSREEMPCNAMPCDGAGCGGGGGSGRGGGGVEVG